ncbi:MAG: sigma-70 family RNA polymerase sigma factor [Acidimicrobiia bacterium]|nr:sigma-70 family RNA polymerase sigma factor [Acidimicrobiia bacterium]
MFPITDWERLKVLRQGAETNKPAVIGELFARYRGPILAFLRRRGYSTERAEDLVQDFFLYCLDERVFEKADPERGRFRNLMLRALTFFAAKQHRHDTAQMRAPDGGFTSIESGGGDGEPLQVPADSATPEAEFTRAWAESLITRVLTTLREKMQGDGHAAHFDIFLHRMIEPALSGAVPPSQAELARKHGITEKEVSNRLVTAKRAYQRRLRAEIATYARSEDEIEDEIRELFQALAA